MNRAPRWPRLLLACLTPLTLSAAGCGGGTDGGSTTPLALFALGGSISGLTGDGLVLANGSDTLAVVAGSSRFTLPIKVAFGDNYSITVKAQPTGLHCTVVKGIGTMGAANVSRAAITCSAITFRTLLETALMPGAVIGRDAGHGHTPYQAVGLLAQSSLA